MEVLQCCHSTHPSKNYCVLCGSYVLKSLTAAIKTIRYVDPMPSYYQSSLPIISNKLKSYLNLSPVLLSTEVIFKLTSLLQKQNWSMQTEAKGIYFYSLYAKEYQPTKPLQQIRYLLMCVFLSAKVQEHMTIKSLRKFRRECDRCFELEEFYELESIILERINFDFNIHTFVDLLEFYLIRGVAFSNQRANPKKIEDRITYLAKSYIRDGTFLKCTPEKLAIFILYKARLEMQCSEVWNWCIEDYSGVTVEKVKDAFEEIRDMLLGIPKIKENRKSLLEVLTPSTPRRILVELQNYIC